MTGKMAVIKIYTEGNVIKMFTTLNSVRQSTSHVIIESQLIATAPGNTDCSIIRLVKFAKTLLKRIDFKRLFVMKSGILTEL